MGWFKYSWTTIDGGYVTSGCLCYKRAHLEDVAQQELDKLWIDISRKDILVIIHGVIYCWRFTLDCGMGETPWLGKMLNLCCVGISPYICYRCYIIVDFIDQVHNRIIEDYHGHIFGPQSLLNIFGHLIEKSHQCIFWQFTSWQRFTLTWKSKMHVYSDYLHWIC